MKTREDGRPKPPTIAGFMTSTEEDDVATRIQSGFRMKVREDVKMG